MIPGICCPRCSRVNPSRARFCASCGLSFLSAGLIRDTSGDCGRGGSGLLGVIAGFVLVFILVALLSFIRITMPRHGQLSHNYFMPIHQEHFRVVPDESERIIRRDIHWRFEYPSDSHIQFRRPACSN